MSRECGEFYVNDPKMLKNTGNVMMSLHTSKTVASDVRNSAFIGFKHTHIKFAALAAIVRYRLHTRNYNITEGKIIPPQPMLYLCQSQAWRKEECDA